MMTDAIWNDSTRGGPVVPMENNMPAFTPNTRQPTPPPIPARKAAALAKRKAKRAARALRRAGARDGIARRLLKGLTDEAIARAIADRADALLDWDAWLNGPVLEEVGDALEVIDGLAIYEGALILVRETRRRLVKAGVIEG